MAKNSARKITSFSLKLALISITNSIGEEKAGKHLSIIVAVKEPNFPSPLNFIKSGTEQKLFFLAL